MEFQRQTDPQSTGRHHFQPDEIARFRARRQQQDVNLRRGDNLLRRAGIKNKRRMELLRGVELGHVAEFVIAGSDELARREFF